jgi:hypothetical protein
MIYLDVDGVIADFEMGVRALGYTGSILGSAGNSCGETLEQFMAKNYKQIFRTAPPTNHMRFFQRMYKEVNSNAPSERIYGRRVDGMEILTAMGSHYKEEHIETVKENKYWWLSQFGFERKDIIIVPQAEDKLAYCKPGDVLYDDKRWTIKRWNQLGGHGFLVYCEPSWSATDD